jgi:hypothetical protein
MEWVPIVLLGGALEPPGIWRIQTKEDNHVLPFKKQGANLLFQLVTRRYEKGSLLITSNQVVPQGARSSAMR